MGRGGRGPARARGRQAHPSLTIAAGRIRPVHVAVLLVAAACLVWARRFHGGGNQYDEGFLLTFADRVGQGAVVHRDFYSNYGPGGPWLLAALFRGLGTHLWVERLLGVASRLLLALGLFALGRESGTAYGAAAFIICALWGLALGPAAYAWILGLSFMTLGVAVAASADPGHPRARAALAGLLMGLAALFRPELVLVAVAASLPALVRQRSRFALPWLSGLSAGLLPLAAHSVVAGPAVVFENLVRFPLLLAGPARHLPIPPTEVRALLFFGLIAGSAATAVIVVGQAWRRRFESRGDLVAGSLGMFSLALTAEALQRADIDHFTLVAIVSVSALPVFVGYRYSRSTTWRPGRGVLLLVCGALLLPLAFAAVRGTPGTAVYNHGREFDFFTTADADATSATISDVERLARPGQRLLVAPADFYRSPLDDADLYWLMPQFVPATYYIQFDPGVANRDHSGLDREIGSADVVILTLYPPDYPDPDVTHNPGGAAPTAALVARFCEVSRHPPYVVLSRCAPRL